MSDDKPFPTGGPRPLPALAHGSRRERLIAGVGAALADAGPTGITVTQVVAKARVSRRAFYDSFEDLDDALLAGHRRIADWLHATIAGQCSSIEDWPAQLRVGLRTTLGFAATSPQLAHLLFIDPFTFEADHAVSVLATRERFAAMLEPGRALVIPAAPLPPITERFLVGAIAAAVGRRIRNGEHAELPALTSPLLQLVLIVYLGHEEAERIVHGQG